MIEVIPGILEQTFDEIQHKVRRVENLVDWIHIDILDNTLIHNVTYNNFDAFKVLHDHHSFEAHLMVSNPTKYIEPLVKSGFKRLIAHVEGDGIRDFLHEAKLAEVEVGVALDGPSELDIVEPFLGEVDTVLLMMYKAGSSGQPFQQSNLPKIKKIHEEYKELPIEVDGGIDRTSASLVRDAGATRLVATSYLFWKNPDRIEEAIEELKG